MSKKLHGRTTTEWGECDWATDGHQQRRQSEGNDIWQIAYDHRLTVARVFGQNVTCSRTRRGEFEGLCCVP